MWEIAARGSHTVVFFTAVKTAVRTRAVLEFVMQQIDGEMQASVTCSCSSPFSGHRT